MTYLEMAAVFFLIAMAGVLWEWYWLYKWQLPVGYPWVAMVVMAALCSLVWPISVAAAIGYACWSVLNGDCCG